jgi:hypothetical protein
MRWRRTAPVSPKNAEGTVITTVPRHGPDSTTLVPPVG